MTEPIKISHHVDFDGGRSFMAHRDGEAVATASLSAPYTEYSEHRYEGVPAKTGLAPTYGSHTDDHRTPTLFGIKHDPPKIDYLWSHGAKPGDVATMLGTMAVHSQKQFGTIPAASESLSDDSARLVNKVNPHIGRKPVQNTLGKFDETTTKAMMRSMKWTFNRGDGDRVKHYSPSEVQEGRDTVRSLFRSNSPKLSKQFDQPELPQ